MTTSFMTYYRVWNKSNTTCAISGTDIVSLHRNMDSLLVLVDFVDPFVLSSFFSPLYCLSFVDLHLLFSPLISSNIFYQKLRIFSLKRPQCDIDELLLKYKLIQVAIPKSGYVHIKTFKSKALSYKVAVTLFCTMVPGWEDISIKLCVVKLQQKKIISFDSH